MVCGVFGVRRGTVWTVRQAASGAHGAGAGVRRGSRRAGRGAACRDGSARARARSTGAERAVVGAVGARLAVRRRGARSVDVPHSPHTPRCAVRGGCARPARRPRPARTHSPDIVNTAPVTAARWLTCVFLIIGALKACGTYVTDVSTSEGSYCISPRPAARCLFVALVSDDDHSFLRYLLLTLTIFLSVGIVTVIIMSTRFRPAHLFNDMATS